MRLHRSATFWSGLLVLAFLLWVWQDSMRYSNHVSFALGGRQHSIGSFAGQLDHVHMPVPPAVRVKTRGSREALTGSGLKLPVIPPAFTWKEDHGFSIRNIAIWVVILALIPPWLGAIYWRHRRWKRSRPA
jgi:hypothetical protein